MLDEIHKYARWRGLLKGLFDKRKGELKILVVGSARLDYYRKGGDSLQGRYHYYRFHPLSLAEIGGRTPADLRILLQLGGFPEPFFSGSAREARRWTREYAHRVIEEDLTSLENVKEVSLLESLVAALPGRVGSPLSLNALKEDLRVAHQTVSRWLTMLENLYMLFRVHPFTGKSLLRSVKKEAKHYHFDWTMVEDPGIRFENLVACHLLKWCHFQQDYEGREFRLHFYRDVDGREVDFVIAEGGKPMQFIECKKSDRRHGGALRYLKSKFPQARACLVSQDGKEDFQDMEGVRHCPARVFLAELI